MGWIERNRQAQQDYIDRKRRLEGKKREEERKQRFTSTPPSTWSKPSTLRGLSSNPRTLPSSRAVRPAGHTAKRILIFLVGLTVVMLVVIGTLQLKNRTTPTIQSPHIQQPAGNTDTTNTILAGAVKHVKSPALNVHEAPGADQPLVGHAPLPQNTAVTLLGQSKTVSDGGTWVLIRAGSVTGWVNQKNLK